MVELQKSVLSKFHWFCKRLFSILLLLNLFDFVKIVKLSCEDALTQDGVCEQNTWKNHDLKYSKITDEGRCNIERINKITNEEFLTKYAFTKPVIISNEHANEHFKYLCEKSALLNKYSNNQIILSTANTHSYDKTSVTLTTYINEFLMPQDISESGKNTQYFFGDNNYTEWKELFKEYSLPPYNLPKKSPALSFGIGGIGSGVPFHFHGPGFSEVIHGRKRWFLYPYDKKPEYDPDQTSLLWVKEKYPDLPEYLKPWECTIRPGEVLYFPDMWWHATLNLDTSVFISTFLG